jgi:3-hydroxypropionate dehydrogenase (NADP+)
LKSTSLPKKVACVGAGIIGSSWALLFAMKGVGVVVYDTDRASLERSKTNVKEMLSSLVGNGVLTARSAALVMSRISPTSDLGGISNSDYVQESVTENLAVKIKALREIEREVSETAIIASSTSGLSISALQRGLLHPERSLVVHPFNPPHLIPLVELVPSEKTSERTVAAARRFMKALGREPILVKKQLPGLAANRIQAAIFREVLNLLDDGVVGMEDLEKVFTAGLGIRLAVMGQFTTFSLAAGEGGLGTYFERYGPHSSSILKTMKTWSEPPRSAKARAVSGERELPVLSMGHEEALRWRDAKLIKLTRSLGYLS